MNVAYFDHRADYRFNKLLKGFSPGVSDLVDAWVYAGKFGSLFDKQADLHMLVGITETNSKHLLLLRWLDVPVLKTMNPGQTKDLYDKLLKRAGKDGQENIRVGGSSGLTDVNENLMNFMNRSGLAPRKSCAVKFFRTPTEWQLSYIKTAEEHRSVGCFGQHCQPQVGGSITMIRKVFSKFTVLHDCLDIKLQLAYVISAVDPTIQPNAVQESFDQVSFGIKNAKTQQRFERLCIISPRNSYTLVTHPVGYHQDSFGGNKPSLENKMCFIHLRFKQTCGRGGAGPSKYVWALLDWRSSNS